jgi:phenylacetate-CoA ligase
MASLRDILYQRSPYTLQNLLISAYGLHLRSIRYGSAYLRALRTLEEAERWEGDRVESHQAERLDNLVRHAVAHVPYYRSRYADLLRSSAKVSAQTLRDHFPILDKRTVKENPRQFVSEAPTSGGRTTVFTSGTTGTPLQVAAAKRAVAENFAFFSHFLRKCGLDPFDWSATFAGRLIVPNAQASPPFWRCNYATRTWLFSSYHIGAKTIPAYLTQLERVQPTYIDSYPSSVYAIARYVVDRGIRHSIRPEAIVTSSEVLTPRQREVTETAFHCPIYDQYGSAEMAAFAAQCAHGSYHAHPLYGLVEVVDRNGRPCGPGETGDLVLTGLINEVMPLIRYRIGDQATLRSEPCACRSTFTTLESILGREDDYIVTPEGNYVGRLDPLFKGLQGLVEAQIVQESPQQVEVLVVPSGDFDSQAQAALIQSLRDRVGNRMSIDVRVVESIPRTKNGKFRSVMSKVREAQISG